MSNNTLKAFLQGNIDESKLEESYLQQQGFDVPFNKQSPKFYMEHCHVCNSNSKMLVLDVGAINPKSDHKNKPSPFSTSNTPHMKLVCGCGATALLNLNTRKVYMKSKTRCYIYADNVYNEKNIKTLTNMEITALQANTNLSLLKIKIDEFEKIRFERIQNRIKRQRSLIQMRGLRIKENTAKLYEKRAEEKNNSIMFKISSYLELECHTPYVSNYIRYPYYS